MNFKIKAIFHIDNQNLIIYEDWLVKKIYTEVTGEMP